MTKRKTTKASLATSAVALLLCFTMLLGTTFAWFTDSVTSAGNIIQTGTLDVEMYWAEGTEDPSTVIWNDASQGAIFNYNNWEPGYVEVRHVKIENKGSLALTYKLSIIANGEVSDLSDVIDVYYLDPAAQIAERDQLNANNKLGTLTEVLANLAETGTGSLAKGEADTITLALKMQETAGNEYQEKALCDGGFSVQLLATQAVGEFDSFGDDYDNNAAADFFPGFQGGSAGIAVTTDDQRLTVGESAINAGDVSAVIPEGVKLADGANSLQLAVTLKNSSDANIQLSEAEKLGTLDVHIEGVAEGNTTPMLVTLKGYLTTGINTGALRLYHVENGATVAMTQVATPVNHNEFSYDPATGDVTLALASFSEVAVVADTNNTWNGTAATAFAGGTGTEANPYLIVNADQLAYFRNEVDGGRTFDNEFVKLDANIYLSDVNFDPIGWGYEYNDWNVGDQAGKPFKGTFDGNGKTIFDLYQSGWDLTNAGTGEAYTYTNCGFGLFAAAADATFKNLTIYGAYVRVECVETGILVGLSQGSCTYNNINIHNSKIANYQRPTGGLIGEISPLNGGGTTTITNVEIGSDVVVGSLWGDFDAPCGGVIGARWDDSNTTTVNMKDVTVGCRMDVYNDITSAYQWHAYRRAGMLIGNTELTKSDDPHKAAAPFLNCENVKVYYGDWANYHYCEFTNQDNAWANNYPWVRVEAGENCSAYSNPRYGQPVVGGVTVSTENHTCNEHNVLRQFSQLYGGGQGVYGEDKHPGVTTIEYKYSITYVNDYEVLDIVYVVDNSKPVDVGSDQANKLVIEWAKKNIGKEGEDFVFDNGWMNAGSTKLTQINADNTKDIVLYPYFNNPYTARFVDQDGNVIAYCFFHEKDTTKLDAAKDAAEAALPDLGEDLEFDYWKVQITDNNGKVTKEEDYVAKNFGGYKKDVTVYPVYLYKGDVNLIPVDTDSDGIIDEYHVAGYSKPEGQNLVEIPDYVNGKPITAINANAFSSYKGVHCVVIPTTIKTVGGNMLAVDWGTLWGKGETVTIYFEGSYAEWQKIEQSFDSKWDNGLGDSSRIFFLNGTDKVDYSQGYMQAKAKTNWIGQITAMNWEKKDLSSSMSSVYTGSCDCDDCDGAIRPDADYWN